jgi:4-hydroxy-tetrahydrodipicolinate synthase
MKFKGIIPPVATIFNQDGSLNQEGMKNMIDADIKSGVHGLFFLGSAGECMHMPNKLRSEVVEFSVNYTNKRLPVLVGAIGCGTADAIAYAQEAERAGADGVVLINPYYAAMTDEAIFRHFAAITEKVSIPAMVYNLPGSTGQSLSISLIKRIAKEIPSIVGLKDTVDTISHTREAIVTVKPERPDFSILCGFDEYLLITLILGGDGCVPASANFAPHLTCGIYDAYCKKDWDTAQKLQRALANVPPLYVTGPPFFGAMKEAIKLSGVDISTYVLPPSMAPDETTKKWVAEMMQKIHPDNFK